MTTHRLSRACAMTLALLTASAVLASCGTAEKEAAQQTSAGRGARDPLSVEEIVGSEGKGMFPGAGIPKDNMPIYAAKDGAVPDGVTPLAHDIFSTRDFYEDRALWSDPRYYRCNSPVGLEQIWGAYEVPLIGDDPPRTAAWGYCDRDYPRAEIVSPYAYKTAKEHYAALMQEARARGGPTVYTRATLPAWDGRYQRVRAKTHTWYFGAILQVPTYLSLLTPEYQKRFVQQMYHAAASNKPQWAGSYCWPEGFMRRFSQYGGGGRINFIVTPDLVMDVRNAAKALITQVHIGREFTEDGNGPPRLGAAVPQWTGEAIGFWDGDALISWVSNLQGWINHGGAEYSSNLQTIEIYTPRKDAAGALIGIKHEIVLYDPDAFVEPVRIVQVWDRVGALNENAPFALAECIPQIFPIKGVATPVSPGTTFEYEYPDIFGRPWAQNWEKYHEAGMKRPEVEDIFSFPAAAGN
jgi:hypothetical protein